MPSTQLRQQVLAKARRLVVKVGSQLLTNDAGELDMRHVRAIADQIATLIARGYDVTLVSSGAIAVGRHTLGLDKRPKDVGVLQAVAAVGQTGLMDRWSAAFAKHGLAVAQMLVTRGDFEDRNRYLNIRNCITELHALRAVPVINENDTVSVDEIRLGDNDVLAALVTNAVAADVLVLLSSVDGVHDSAGNVVEMIDDADGAQSLVQKQQTSLGTGGMGTKLAAAKMVTDAGELAVITGGRVKDVLLRLTAGEKVGTVFVPADKKLEPRRRWIGQAGKAVGEITIDDGAARAVTQRGKSLLATGITAVTGSFKKGDIIIVRDPTGAEIARGLTNYAADETRTIMGKRTSQFEKLLGRKAYDEVIHRDNLVLSGR